jgi:DNA helicase-2/ATP-dependent DNA helicase PcrA
MSTPPWLAGLNDEQRAAAEATTGPVCILAGAGTGKTRTITHRIAHQVHSGVAQPSQILAVTFTDKAAAELRQRLHVLGLPSPVRAATFHAAAWAQLRWFWPRCNDGPLPEVLASKLRLLVPLARRTHTEAKDLAAEIEWAKARRLSPAQYEAAAADRDAPLAPPRMAAVYEEYERAKTEQSLIDYDDMLLHTLALLETQPEMAAEVRDRYRHFTVDEFQDVNPAQFGLLRAWLGDRDDVCVVGDDDQTIYSFTGATSQYLREFPAHFPGTTRVTLTRNYRSTPQVLGLANKVLWTKPAATRKHLAADLASGPAPAFVEHADNESELAAVVAGIQALLADGTPPGEIAVLYRVNSQSEPLEAALGKAGIPFVMAGGGGFYEQDEIRGALRVLAAAAPQPDTAPLGLEDTAAASPPGLADRVRRTLRQQMGWNPKAEPRGEAARERWRNLATLVELSVGEAQAAPELTLGEFVQRLQARAAVGADAAGDTGAVTLSTLHRAKGREFDAVFLIAAEEGLLPISHAKTDEAVEEERRLLYVGVTRARRHLTISWAQRRPGYSGKIVSRRPSRLLYNLGEGAPVKGPSAVKPKAAGATARECKCGRPLVASVDRKRGRCWSCFSGGASPEVAQRLRTWRKERAADDDVPAFVVFNDTTLAELARVQPRTRRDLLSVTGIGPAKVERYGDALLEVLDVE